MITPYEGYVEVCEALAELTPGDHAKKVGAVQLRRRGGRERRQDRPRARPASTPSWSFDHAYHGRTNLTMALTAKNMPYKHGFGPFAAEVYRVPMSYPFREPGASPASRPRPGRSTMIEKQVGADNLAAS